MSKRAYRSFEQPPTPNNSAETDRPQAALRQLGAKILGVFNSSKQSDHSNAELAGQLVKDVGSSTLNKGVLIGDYERRNEDSSFNDPSSGLFGVFDGMGGHYGGANASEAAAMELANYVDKHPISTPRDLQDVMHRMSEAIRNDPNAGGSTAVLGQIVQNAGQKYLLYAWAGDSRLYHVRKGKANQITEDEGIGNQIYNYLGIPSNVERPARTGVLPLQSGDHLLFCSDGITGDYEKDFIPNDEIAHIVENSGSADAAADNLIRRATKKDDRTAIVVEV